MKKFVFLLLLIFLRSSFVIAQPISPTSFTLQTAASSGNGTDIPVSGFSLATLSILGTAGSDRVVTFSGSGDGTNFSTLTCRNLSSLATSTTLTTSGTTVYHFSCPIGGLVKLRAAISGGATGTITIKAVLLPNVTINSAPSLLTPFVIGDLFYADSTSSIAKLAAVATGSILASGGVGTAPAWSATPTVTTSVTTPLIIGGTAVGSSLSLKSTSATGTTDYIRFLVGDNGGTEAIRILTSGFVGIGYTAPVTKLQVNGSQLVLDVSNSFALTKFDSQGAAWSTRSTDDSIILNDSATKRPEISWLRGTRTYPELSIRQHTTNDTGGEVYAGGGQAAPTKILEYTVNGTLNKLPTTEVITAGAIITADACGGIKRISSASALTTSTTNTITAPAAANAGCIMSLCNMNAADAITLDKNANILLVGGADVALAAGCCIQVYSSGASGVWKQTTAQLCSS